MTTGFVWRLRSGEAHGATVVYRSRHGAYVRRRSRWFVPVEQPSTVLWWVGAGEPGRGQRLGRKIRTRTRRARMAQTTRRL
jgi:Domain of unknown function (DUF3291)